MADNGLSLHSTPMSALRDQPAFRLCDPYGRLWEVVQWMSQLLYPNRQDFGIDNGVWRI